MVYELLYLVEKKIWSIFELKKNLKIFPHPDIKTHTPFIDYPCFILYTFQKIVKILGKVKYDFRFLSCIQACFGSHYVKSN